MKPKFTIFLFVGILALWAGLGSPPVLAQALRPEAEAGRLLTQARASMRAEKWADARKALEQILEIDIELPVTFHYQYALTLNKTNDYAQALERLSLYLNDDDAQGDDFYSDALALFNDTEAALARQKAAEEAERQRALAAEKAKQEAAERARQKALAEARAKQEAAEKAKREAEAKARKAAEDNRLHNLYLKNGQEAEAKKDYKTAFAEYTKAYNLKKTNETLVLRLAELYARGNSVERNGYKAVSFLFPLIATGSASAEVYYRAALFRLSGARLRWSYDDVDIGSGDKAISIAQSYREAIKKGHAEARKQLISYSELLLQQEDNYFTPHTDQPEGRVASETILSYDRANGYYYMGRFSERAWIVRPKDGPYGSVYPASNQFTLDCYSKAIQLGHNKAKEALIEFCFSQAGNNYKWALRPYTGKRKYKWKYMGERREEAHKAIYWYQHAANNGSAEAAKRIQELKKKLKI